MYQPPRQPRAQVTEQRLLTAMEELLRETAFNKMSIQKVAARAGLDKGVFIKRFGSKKSALLIMFKGYCLKIHNCLDDLREQLPNFKDAQTFFMEVSLRFEALLLENFSCNRAMHELFQEELKVDPLTIDLFLATVKLMQETQSHFSSVLAPNKSGAFAATQLLVTINFNYALKAMPALPPDDLIRHRLIARLMVESFNI